VPCDVPLFPRDLAVRLAQALDAAGDGADGPADLAIACAPQADRHGAVALRPQPVFCLMRATLRGSLERYVGEGGRKIDAWTARHRATLVPFDRSGDAPDAFRNANTVDELDALRRLAARPDARAREANP
jgi:molybdopterin-guanine dinucleotide biosynthesis protein A